MELNIVLYITLINLVSVTAKGGHGGGHGGGHSGGHGSSHGGGGYHSSGYHVSAHHTQYSYHPPSHITFACRSCGHMTTYPVYHGQPPAYVYKYRESPDRFGDLLTGLALYNLGRSSAVHGHYYEHNYHHTSVPDERCSLQVIDKSHFEETPFDCFMMSSFVREAGEMKSVNNSYTVDITSSNNLVDASTNIGPKIQVTNDQVCMLWHNQTMSNERKEVPCTLLKQYADTMKSSGVPVYVWLPTLIGTVIVIYLCCHLCCHKKKEVKEEEPLNQVHVIRYCTNTRVE